MYGFTWHATFVIRVTACAELLILDSLVELLKNSSFMIFFSIIQEGVHGIAI